METTSGYKTRFEKKNERLYLRLDESMIDRLKQIRRETGISVSELCRESLRRLIQEASMTGDINLKID
jgi:antitoxin component of RelBE/YafQ-DinJ toxin-antitoxin module